MTAYCVCVCFFQLEQSVNFIDIKSIESQEPSKVNISILYCKKAIRIYISACVRVYLALPSCPISKNTKILYVFLFNYDMAQNCLLYADVPL